MSAFDFEIRIFNQFKDVKLSVRCNSKEQLKDKFNSLLAKHEGETYAIWDIYNNECIVGGAMDPSDIEIIEEY